MENKLDTFHYTYSAQQQAEVDMIRAKYLPPREDKLETLRRLDNSVHKKPMALSLSLGVVGALLLGTGMSLIMTDLAAVLGFFRYVLGLVLGINGLVAAILAWPVYEYVLKRERQRLAPEILRLSEELMK